MVEGHIEGEPERWTSSVWWKVYRFPRGEEGLAPRTDKFIDGKFFIWVNLNDGFTISKCKGVRARRVLEFLVPILYSEKPTQVTITVGNKIFKALSRERKVDWPLVIRDVVIKLLFGVEKIKPTAICP